MIFSCWILIRGVFVSDREPTSSWQTTAMLNSVRGTRKASAITFCFKRLNLNGLIYWLCLSPVAPSYNNLFLLSLTFYLFLPNHIPSLSPFILSPFSTLPTLFISFFPFFLSSPFSVHSWLWCIGPDHSNSGQEEVVHWNSVLVSCACFSPSAPLTLHVDMHANVWNPKEAFDQLWKVCEFKIFFDVRQSEGICLMGHAAGTYQNVSSICFMHVLR